VWLEDGVRSVTDNKNPRALVGPTRQKNYDVGYGKPPGHSRFKPRQSGNPSGRPRGSKTRRALPALNEERLKAIVLEEAYRTIRINDADKQISVPMAQAVVRSLAVNAVKGNQRAQRLFTELLASVEIANKRLHDEWLQTAIDYKVDWERELERRNSLGIDAPAPIPHPDDLIIDMKAGTVHVKGPMTKEEKAQWDYLRERKAECDREIAELGELFSKTRSPARRKVLSTEIDHERNLRKRISSVIAD
jgi:hypothetical protein